jgi:hypothetical protein
MRVPGSFAPGFIKKTLYSVSERFTIPVTGLGNDSYMDYFEFSTESFSGIPVDNNVVGFQGFRRNYPNPASHQTRF